MNKLSKGLIAAGTATLLLLGTGGTIAYWNATQEGADTTITAGHLKLAQTGTPGWTVAHGTSTGVAFIPASDKIVPGDSLTYTGTYTVNAVGKNLKYKVEIDDGSLSVADAALVAQLTDPTYTVTSAATTGVTIDPLTNVITVDTATGDITFTVTATLAWPFGDENSTDADNAAQDKSATLSGFALTVTQVLGH